MRIPSRVDGSFCAAVLSNRPLAGLRAAAAAATSTTRRRPLIERGNDASPRTLKTFSQGGASLQRTSGLQSSIAASSNYCPRSSQWLLSTFAWIPKDHRLGRTRCARRGLRTSNGAATAATAATTPSDPSRDANAGRVSPTEPVSAPCRDKEYLLSFVDNYYEASVQEHFDFYRDPYRRGYAASDGPRLRVSEKKSDVQYPNHDEVIKPNERVQALLIQLCAIIAQRLRHPSRCSLDSIYRLYSQLPEPRMLHLTWQWRNRLLKVMGTPLKRDSESMLRYFSLVADVKTAGLTLRRSQWNLALAFASKYVGLVTTQEMEAVLRLWKEMERDAHVMGNEVTFNILFDVATKAGNFILADMIYKEMESRGFEFNRFHHVSLIHFFGLRLDSGGIRAAYREMVESGEMIDTLALNCVIAGLLRCGEESAAERIYQRMKAGHSLAAKIPRKDYMMQKVVTKVLMMFAQVGRRHPELQRSLQGITPLDPDIRTYKLFVNHYAVKVGDLPKVARYLDEMKHLEIPLDATIFLSLLKGFYLHGGFPGSDWSRQRLEGVLSALYLAHDEHAKGFRIDRWLVIWALRAVKKCSSDEELVKTFDLMSQRWIIKPDREPFMHAIFENILYNRDLRLSRGKWDGP